MCQSTPGDQCPKSPGASPLETLVTGNSPISFPRLPLFQTGLATSMFKVEAEALQVPCHVGTACGGMAVLAHPNSEDALLTPVFALGSVAVYRH